MKLQAKVRTKRLQDRLARMIGEFGDDEMQKLLEAEGRRAVEQIRKRLSRPFDKQQLKSRGKFPRMRKGDLRDAVDFEVAIQEGKIYRLRFGILDTESPVGKYAKIQNKGGVIKMKDKMLAIPLPAAMDSRGVAMFTPAEARSRFSAVFARNNVILGRQGDTLVPLFALRRSVKIPARPFVRPGMDIFLKNVSTQFRNKLRRSVAGRGKR